ncbi:MAG: cytochrome C oxidase subunit II [Gemmatimonadota bacterium]|nr:cytochrome C oxidase subunit II [Gemmatimonadota bacterium]
MIDFILSQGSSYAAGLDRLVLLILLIVGFWFLLAQSIFFGFIMKFRAKPGQKAQYITGKEKHQKRWVTYPHLAVLVFDVAIVIASFNVWYTIKMDLPPADAEIRVIGQQWAWTFQHPGADGTLDTPDDIFTIDELHVENGKTYHYKLESRDVLHDFSVPVWRLKQDAVPGRSITGWFQPTESGTFDVQCAEICGFGHGLMAARVIVEDAGQHADWVAANTPEAS